MTRVVACLGSSSTAGHGIYDWIGDVAKRQGNESWRFRRFAAGGDLAYNGLQRAGQIVVSSPDAVIVLLGGNDVLASVFPRVERFLGGWKRLPRKPSPDWYRETMLAIVRTLAKGAVVALRWQPPAPPLTFESWPADRSSIPKIGLGRAS
jgi:lysophospholipase L1-like esterase